MKYFSKYKNINNNTTNKRFIRTPLYNIPSDESPIIGFLAWVI